MRVWRWSLPIGIVLGVLFALRDYTMSARSPLPMPLWYWTAGEVAVFLFWSVCTPLVLFLMNRFPLQKRNWLRNGSLHVAVYCGLAAVYTLYYRGVDDWLSAEQADSLRNGHVAALARDDVPLLGRGHDHLRLRQLALAQLHVACQLPHHNACGAPRAHTCAPHKKKQKQHTS